MLEILKEKFILRGVKRKIAECILVFAVSFVLSGVDFYCELAPVGVCFQGCFAGRRRMFFSFLGVVLGACVWGYAPLKYIAVSLIIVVLNEAFMHIADIGNFTCSVIGVSGAMGLIGVISLISPESENAGLLYVAELVICIMLSLLLFGVAGGKSMTEKQGGKTVSLILVCAFCASLVPAFSVGRTEISLAEIIISGLTLFAAIKTGIFGGVIVGLVSGLALDLSGVGVPLWCFSLAVGGVGAGFSIGKKPAVRALFFFLLSSGARLLALGSSNYIVGVGEILLGTLPVFFFPSMYFDESNRGDDADECDILLLNSKKHMADLLLGMSDAYSAMANFASDGEAKVPHKKIGLSLYEDACKSVCSLCEHKNFCWEDRAKITREALESALPKINSRGNARCSDFGEDFSCVRGEAFCQSVTNSLRRQRLDMLDRGEKLTEDFRMHRQYRSISDILEDSVDVLVNDTVFDRDSGRAVKKLIAGYGVEANVIVFKDSRGVLHVEISGEELNVLTEHSQHITRGISSALGCVFEAPIQTEGKDYSCITFKESSKFDFTVGATAEKRQGEGISGDSATYFRDNEGNMLVVLCDGMGSGEKAHKHAEEIMHLCESFLRIGVSPRNTAEIIAASLEQKDRGAGGVTMDIMRIDPYTSVLTSVKYGAAPTYVRHRTADGRYSLSKICAGGGGGELYGVAEVEIELQEGDLILMASDGAENGNNIEKNLVGIMTDDPGDLCEILMHMLPRDAADDRTLIAASFYAKSDVYVKRKNLIRV